MTRLLLPFYLILFFLNFSPKAAIAQAPAWRSAASFGGLYSDYGADVTSDAAGNRYFTGGFVATANFGGFSITSAGEEDIYIAKADSAGTLLWVKRIGGPGVDRGSSITLDTAGNIYVVGSFASSVNFLGTTLSGSSGSMFLLKLSPAGDLIWVKSSWGGGGAGVAVDISGSCYVTGTFSGTVYFGSTTVVSNGYTDFYIAKYDSAGNLAWVQSFGGTSPDFSHNIQLDGSGNPYIAGTIQGTVNMAGTILTSAGISDAFVAKFTPQGAVTWVRKAGGTGWDYAHDLAVDSIGNSWITGTFRGSMAFGTTTIFSAGTANNDMYVASYSPSGTLRWARRGGGNSYESGQAVAVDKFGNSYVAGSFSGTTVFGSFSMVEEGSGDVFVVKYDSLGNVNWAVSGGGPFDDSPWGITVEESGFFSIVGRVGGSATFGNITFAGNGYNDALLARLGPPIDVGVSAVVSPESGCELSNSSNVTITITNYSESPHTGFGVAYRLNNQPAVTENIGPLVVPVGGTLTYTFATPADLSAPGSYSLVAFTQLANDTDYKNDTTTVTIISQSVPAMPAVTSQSICGPGTASLTATGGNATDIYRWYATSTGGVALHTGATYTTPSIATTTTYYVELYNGLCAGDRATATVIVNQLPSVSVTQATAANGVQLDVQAGPANYSYQWSPSSGLSASNVSNPIATPSATTTYTVTVTDIASGCSTQQSITVVVTGVAENTSNAVTLTVLPNPFTEYFTARVEASSFGRADYILTDMLGRILISGSRQTVPGENSWILEEAAKLGRGIYLFTIQLEGQAISKKLIKVE